MSRKDESKNKAKDAIVTVNIDDFTRTRDSVIVSLATLQSAVSDLSRAYINHANTVLNRGPVSVENPLSSGLAGGLATTLLENGLLGAGLPRHSSPPPDTSKTEEAGKKKRKRAPPDPNAPKRALTPYFLYMQHNRAQIADELGPQAKPKDVSDEGTRRWAEMSEQDKAVWQKLYANNLAIYKAKMQAYKAGLPVPDDDHAQADTQLQQSVAAAEAEAAEHDQSDSDDNEDESSEEPSKEPSKEPTPPPSNKRRRGGAKASDNVSTPVSSSKKASPEKKKTPAPKAKEAKEAKETKESSRKSLGGAAADSKPSKKKRKSDVAGKD